MSFGAELQRGGDQSITTPNQIIAALTSKMPNAGKTLIGSLISAFSTLTPMYHTPKRKNKPVSGPPSLSEPAATSHRSPAIAPIPPQMMKMGAI
ncbi:MAG TPA: hypothetical protein VMG59_00105 [Phycisphaerae bacterium]|nr:hypothetical protein [Phycisphaerae bacterium]